MSILVRRNDKNQIDYRRTGNLKAHEIGVVFFILLFVASIAQVYYTQTKLVFFQVVYSIFVAAFYFIFISACVVFKSFRRNLLASKLSVLFLLVLVLGLLRAFFSQNFEFYTLFFNPLSFIGFLSMILMNFYNSRLFDFSIKFFRIFIWFVLAVTFFDIYVLDYPVTLSSSYSMFFFILIYDRSRWVQFLLIIILLLTIFVFKNFDYRAGVVLIIGFLLVYLLVIFGNAFRFLVSRFFLLIVGLFTVFQLFFNFKSFLEKFGNQELGIDITDTRSFIFDEFYDDFSSTELLVGKGFLGKYYSQYFYNWQGEFGDDHNRFSVEIGILHVILKGGVLMLGIVVLYFFQNLRISILNTQYEQTKFLCGSWILFELILMTIENRISLHPHFIVLWLIFGVVRKGA